jgi:hypothetical protein
MKLIYAMLTGLLLVSVGYATTITVTEPHTFTIIAHKPGAATQRIQFVFASDADPGEGLDSVTVTHLGGSTGCLSDGTHTFSDPLFIFSCSGFVFNAPATTVVFNEPSGSPESDSISLFNDGAGGLGGTFVSAVDVVAEPAGLAVLGSGLLILGGVLRRRVRKGTPPGAPQ